MWKVSLLFKSSGGHHHGACGARLPHTWALELTSTSTAKACLLALRAAARNTPGFMGSCRWPAMATLHVGTLDNTIAALLGPFLPLACSAISRT